jgi:FkbM family methyltransferase
MQSSVYALKSITKSPVGRRVNRLAKIMAGMAFDIFIKTYKTGGMEFTIPKHLSTMEMRGKFFADSYELPERTLSTRHLKPTDTVLELGASLGVVSCSINKTLENRSAHVAIEANPLLIPTLQNNRDTNGAKFHVINAVLSNKEVAYISTDRVMDSNSVSDTGVKVDTISVSEIENKTKLIFNALIMDIEGGEYDVVSENSLLLKRLRLAIIEFHPWLLSEKRVSEIRSALTGAGLRKVDAMLTVECWVRD